MKNKKILYKKKIKNPYYSIITVVKNDEKNISKTIQSIKHQKFKNYEYIIVDGFSKDKTVPNILKYKKNINLLISEKDKGIYYAMNKGARIASGKIIIFVNSGDELTRNALKIIKKKFKENIDFVFGTVKRHYTNKVIFKYGYNIKKLYINFDFATAHSTGFYIKNTTFKSLNYFNTKYKCSADYDLYFRLIITLKKDGSFTNKNQLIGVVQSGGFSSKLSFMEHLIEEIKIRIDNKQNKFIIIIIIFNALIKHLLKKIF